MAVVINEFETVADTTRAPATGQAAAAPPTAAPAPPQPQDVRHVLRVLQERSLRVWAH
jgi:hypothetical protein